MIDWIKYDQENPPEEEIQFLVHASGCVYLAKLNKLVSFQRTWLDWIDTTNGMEIHDVTHYANINLPREDVSR